MKLTDVVATHGFQPCELVDINNAKLYQRKVNGEIAEVLCVQKIGDIFRIDSVLLMELAPGMLVPVGQGVSNQLVPKDLLEKYLSKALSLTDG